MTHERPDLKKKPPWPQYRCLTCFDTGKVFSPMKIVDGMRELDRVPCPNEIHKTVQNFGNSSGTN